MGMTWRGEEAKAELGRRLSAQVRRAAEAIHREAATRCPRDTGALAASGKVVMEDGALHAEVRYGDGLPDARAEVQEFGTMTQPPRAYLRGGLEAAVEEVRRIFTEK